MLEKIQAISDPTRFAILQLVREQELPAGTIAQQFPSMTRPAVSQHLRVLKQNNLVAERREGTKRLYRINTSGFDEIRAFLESFWDPRLAKLKALAEKESKEST